MTDKTLFEKIVDNEIPNWKIWEDEQFLAFLSPFPSTPGLTVVTFKKNPGAYVFELTDEQAAGLCAAAKKVARLLEKAFDVPRVGLVFEGEGVPHVHAKLYPLHGIQSGKAAASVHFYKFYPEYPGFIDTGNGPKMSDEELTAIQQKIRKAAE